MDGNRELEQLDAEARALKATLMRYMSEALIEDQGLNKLTAELTKIVQASQRHTAEFTVRAEQRIQAVAATVEALRGELRTLVNQSHEQLLREVRTLLSEQAGKRKKTLDTDVLTEQLDRLQAEVRKLATGLQLREARGNAGAVAIDADAPTPRAPRGRNARAVQAAQALPLWRFAVPLAALLLISVGYNIWLATRSDEPKADTTAATAPDSSGQGSSNRGASKQLPAKPAPATTRAPAASVPVQAPVATVANLLPPPPDVRQAAWDKIWNAALELPLQQCWGELKSNAKVSKFRDCVCPKGKSEKDKSDKDMPCELSSKWSAEASAAALQAVLSVAAAKPMTIDAKVGAGTFNAIDLVVKDCGFKEPALMQAIEELRTTRGRAPAEGKEPAAQQILSFMRKNLHSCR